MSASPTRRLAAIKQHERKRGTLAPRSERAFARAASQAEWGASKVYSDLPSDVPVSSAEMEAIEIYLTGDLDLLFG